MFKLQTAYSFDIDHDGDKIPVTARKIPMTSLLAFEEAQRESDTLRKQAQLVLDTLSRYVTSIGIHDDAGEPITLPDTVSERAKILNLLPADMLGDIFVAFMGLCNPAPAQKAPVKKAPAKKAPRKAPAKKTTTRTRNSNSNSTQ